MKDLYTKTLSGEPLAHDEWVKRQQAIDAAALAAAQPKPTPEQKPADKRPAADKK